MLNKVILIGHVGADPEIRTMANGNTVTNFPIATSERWRDKQTGARQERTEWHRVVVFNDALQKVLEQYVQKGSKVYIAGKLRTRKWTDNQGVDRYTTEIVLDVVGAELVLLGDPRSREDNRGDAHDEEEQHESRGNGARGGNGRSNGRTQNGAGNGAQAGGGRRGAFIPPSQQGGRGGPPPLDLDDEIPF